MNFSTVIEPSDRFSCFRALMFGRRYEKEIRRQTIVYMAVTFVTFFSELLPTAFSFVPYLGTVVIGLMIILSPYIFARDDDAAGFIMVPARTDEKFWFCVLYTCVFIPLVTIGLWNLLATIGSLFSDRFFDYEDVGFMMFNDTEVLEIKELVEGSAAWSLLKMLVSLTSQLVPIVTTLFVALIARKSARFKTLITPFALIIILMILSLIAGIAFAIIIESGSISWIDKITWVDELETKDFVFGLYSIILGFSIIYVAGCLGLLYHRLKRRQV